MVKVKKKSSKKKDDTRNDVTSIFSFFKPTARRIMIPRGVTVEESIVKKSKKTVPTIIPELKDENFEEVEIVPIKEPYSYVRISFNKELNEYFYEVIEPQLTKEEEEILDFMTKSLINIMRYEFDARSTREEKEEHIKKSMDELLIKIGLYLDQVVKDKILYYLNRNFVGYGPLDVLMIDEMIEDISCDGPEIPLFVFHRKYESVRTNVIFPDDPSLDSFVINLAQRCGKHISVAEPMLDATLPDGSRLQATLSREVTTRGSSFTIRRFKADPFTPTDLLRYKTISTEMLAYMWLAVEHGESIIICGGTASGKTSTMNAIMLFIPPAMKIVTIEDTREINIPHENWLAGLTRTGFGRDDEGNPLGEVDMYELLRAALRQRPQYLIVGEVRGKETYTMFQAMATGHTVYSTMHADSVKAMVYRLENPPINLPRILLSALNIAVIQAQVKVGRGIARRIKSIVEIVGIEPDTNELITNTVYAWNSADDSFVFNGHSFLFERIMSMKNMTTAQMKEEFKRRVEVMEWMGKMNIRHHEEVANLIAQYYNDPDKLIQKIRSELYG